MVSNALTLPNTREIKKHETINPSTYECPEKTVKKKEQKEGEAKLYMMK